MLNLAQWRAHLFARLRRQIAASADPVLKDLLSELMAYPAPEESESRHAEGNDSLAASVAVPLRLASEAGVLSFMSTITVFGSPLDITLSELALETFFPADADTAAVLRAATPHT